MTLDWNRDRAGIYTTHLTDGSRLQAERHGSSWHLWLYSNLTAAPERGGTTFYGDFYNTLADAKAQAEVIVTRRDSAAFYTEQAHRLIGEAARSLRIARKVADTPVTIEAIDSALDDATALRRLLVSIIATANADNKVV